MAGTVSFKIKTDIFGNGLITQELYRIENDVITETTRWVVNTREKEIRDALIKLGWIPPKEERTQNDKTSE